MHRASPIEAQDKPTLYAELAEQGRGLLAGERDAVANAANLVALLWHALPDCNWIGFYFYKEQGAAPGELVVGPFQGRPACVRIAMGKGVCGTAAASRRTQVVRDVAAFPGHIACDVASRSEIVVPLVAPSGNLLGVLDLDSPSIARFDDEDRVGLERIAADYVASVS